MKTNVVLQSSDRELFGVTIRQNTKEEFLSVTDLQNAYEKARFIHGWSEKRINDMLGWVETRNRIYYLLLERGIIKTSLNDFIKETDSKGVTKVLKELGLYKTTGKGENKTVMCDPYIWILLAMEMNPMIYAKVVIWLTDSLIFDRIDAGSEYLPMNKAIKSIIENPDYTKYAIAINKRIFGIHQVGIRNLACAKELRKIADIEKFIINAIEMQMLRSESQIIKAIETYR